MSLNLEEIINRAISIAQASGQAKRDTALEVAKMNAETYKSQGDKQLEIAHLAAGTDRYKADTSAQIAETNLRGDMYKGDSQVHAANIGLIGNTVKAGAEAYDANLRAASPIVSGIVKAQSEMQQYPENATDKQKAAIDRDNNSRQSFIDASTKDPNYIRASGAQYDPVAAAHGAAVGLGVPLGGLRSQSYFGAQPNLPLRVEPGRTPQAQSLRFPTPNVDTPTLTLPRDSNSIRGAVTPPASAPVDSLIKDRRPKSMDPSRQIGLYN